MNDAIFYATIVALALVFTGHPVIAFFLVMLAL